MAPRLRGFSAVSILLLTGLGACSPPKPPPPPAVLTPIPSTAAPPAEQVAFADPGTIVPVTPNEASMGSPLAPVTWVLWGDYECPHTASLFLRLNAFLNTYGPDKLRIVWWHFPQPFHPSARSLAIAAETVLRLGGPRAFWSVSAKMFAKQGSVGMRDIMLWAADMGVDPTAFADAVVDETFAHKVDEDSDLARTVGASGTPASFINGAYLSGAQRDESFVALIDAQLDAANKLVIAGAPRERVYAIAVEKSYKKPAPPEPVKKAAPPDTTTVWKVPVGKSPQRGKATALVTIVMFGDFECPFCGAANATIKELEQEYGDKLRIVFKHNPLPFHKRAEPAAQFAIEARAQGGDKKFWAAYDILFANRRNLTDQAFEEYAKTLGISAKLAALAVKSSKHRTVIDEDWALAEDLSARGTPQFFVNGRRIIGAQPKTVFKPIIDEEIARAQSLLAKGTPPAKLYDALQKDAREPPAPERIIVPQPAANNPAKGAKAGPKVAVVQMFTDFECSYCKSAHATMDELIAALPGKVRVVWRHRPIKTHPNSELAAEASMEVLKQKGEAVFWKFAALLFEETSALDKETLLKKAATLGVDTQKMGAALDAGTHKALVEADLKLAESLKITGAPTFAVGDYYVQGAQPLRVFKRAVQRALGPKAPVAPESIHGAPKQDSPDPP